MGKLLFIRGGAVGDFILTMPAIELVREGFPDLEIEILGYPSIASLAVEAGLADRTRSIEHATMAPFFAPGAKLDPETCAYFKGFDVVVSYLYDPDGFFAGNLERAGVETLIEGPFRMDESDPDSLLSAPVQLAAPLERLALFLEKSFVELNYGDSEEAEASGLTVAIHPGSGSASKNWSFEGWVDLAGDLVREFPEVSFLIISGEAETETIGDFLRLFDARDLRYRHANQMDLSELGRMIRVCELFLGHDSGISHLAASTGIPGLVLFGPTNPGIWAPQHPAFDFIQAPEGQLGNLSWENVRDHPLYRGKLSGLRER